MKVDPLAQSLSMLNRFAGSDIVHRLGLYQPAQRLVQRATRDGFKVAGTVARQFKAVQKRVQPERLPPAAAGPGLFDLSIHEDQQMMRDMAQRFAKEVLRPAAPRADADRRAPEGFDDQLAELGLAQFVVPESLGGIASERSVVTQVLVAEDLAHGDMGLAVAALAPVAVANALVRWGSADQQSKYLPAFADAKPPSAALAVAERRAAFDPRSLRTRAHMDADGFKLNGEKTLVPLAGQAELFLVAADVVGKGPRLFIVEAGTPGLTVEDEAPMGVRAASYGKLKLDDVRLPHAGLLGEHVDVLNYEELLDLSSLAWCALAVGTSQAVLDYAIPYCNDRKAFGEPISHRQSVAFMIANIGIELEAMRLLTWRAAARADAGEPFHREAYLARTLCAEKAAEIGTHGVQLLGGHGFVKEHPVERWYRDLLAVGVMEGGLLL
jgi:alkylation response protein AidB-like acyl-CoA dehydrogenase